MQLSENFDLLKKLDFFKNIGPFSNLFYAYAGVTLLIQRSASKPMIFKRWVFKTITCLERWQSSENDKINYLSLKSQFS